MTWPSAAVRVYRVGLARLLGWLAVGLAVVPVCAAALVYGVPLPQWTGPPVSLAVAGAAILGVASAIYRGYAVARPGELARREGMLHVTRRGAPDLRVAPEELTNAVFVAAASPRLELELRGGRRVVAEVRSETAATRLLEALGWDKERRRTRIDLARPGPRIAAGVLFGALTMVVMINLVGAFLPHPSTSSALATVASIVACIWAAAAFTRPPVVTVGLDGMEIVHAARRRYLRFEEIASIELLREKSHQVSLRLHDGEELRLAGPRTQDDDLARTLVARVRRGLAAGARDATSAEKLRLLERDGRAIASWRAELAGAFAHADDYRRAPLSTEDALAILSADGVRGEHRLAAAIALSGSDGHREALRVAASACTGRRLRVAIEAAAEGSLSDDATLAALAEQEAEETIRRPK